MRDSGVYKPLALQDRVTVAAPVSLAQAEAFLAYMRKRHSVRDFSPEPVAEAVIAAAVAAAGTAPSGANHQPWHFVAVGDLAVIAEIRAAAEAEKRAF